MSAEEELLRRALEAEAGRVEVAADALSVIRRRVAARRGWRRFLVLPRFGVGAALAATAAVIAVSVAVATLLPRSPAPHPPGASGSPVTASADEALATPPGSVAVYYLGATRSGPLLYREFHHPGVASGSPVAAKVTAAIDELLDHPAFDPDYTSAWPAGARLNRVSIDGDTVTVDLAGATVNAVDARRAAAGVQQLVWTATAPSDTVTGVRLLFDGKPLTTLWGSVPVGGVLHRGNALDVRAPVWLIDPQQGATVGRTFTVFVAGTVPEGAARLRVRSSAGVVQDSPVTLDQGAPALGTAKMSLTLDPGRYTIEAFYVSPADSSAQFVDDHEFTVGSGS